MRESEAPSHLTMRLAVSARSPGFAFARPPSGRSTLRISRRKCSSAEYSSRSSIGRKIIRRYPSNPEDAADARSAPVASKISFLFRVKCLALSDKVSLLRSFPATHASPSSRPASRWVHPRSSQRQLPRGNQVERFVAVFVLSRFLPWRLGSAAVDCSSALSLFTGRPSGLARVRSALPLVFFARDTTMGILECPTIIRVMRTPHKAEGHLLSLRSPLDRLSVTDCQGSGYRRQRILESPGVAGAAIQPESYPLSCSALAPSGKKATFRRRKPNPSASRQRHDVPHSVLQRYHRFQRCTFGKKPRRICLQAGFFRCSRTDHALSGGCHPGEERSATGRASAIKVFL